MNCSPWLHEASYNRLGFYIWPSTQGPWTVKLLMSNVLIYWAICDTLSIFELFWVIIFKNTYHFIWHICLPNQLFWIIDFSKHLYFAAIVNSDSPLYLYSDTRTGRGSGFFKNLQKKRVILRFCRSFNVVFQSSEMNSLAYPHFRTICMIKKI